MCQEDMRSVEWKPVSFFMKGTMRSNHLTTLIRSWYGLCQIQAERGPKRTRPCVKWRLTPEIGMLEILLNDVN
jgi:hypothetical protein